MLIFKSEKTKAMQCYQFIRQLQMRGNDAYTAFYETLLRSRQRFVIIRDVILFKYSNPMTEY